MQTRTRRQKEVLDFITRYIDRHGHDPSYQVIARHLGVSSKAGIAKHVAALEEQGLLERRRVDGSFKLFLRRPESNVSVCEIDWIDGDAAEGEDWECRPFVVPQFFLGNILPTEALAFRVPDDAMSEKQICSGDVVIVERRPHVRDGSCVAVTADKLGTMVRCYFRDGAEIELRAANDRYEDVRLSADKVEVVGLFRGLIRPVV